MRRKIWRLKNDFFAFGGSKEEQANELQTFRQQLVDNQIKIGIDQFENGLFSFYGSDLVALQKAVDLYYENSDIHYFVVQSKNKRFAELTKVIRHQEKQPLKLFIKELWTIWFAFGLLMMGISLATLFYMFILLPKHDIINNILLPILTNSVYGLNGLFVLICGWKIIKRRRKC